MVSVKALIGSSLRSWFGLAWIILALMIGSGITVGFNFWFSSAKPYIVQVNSIKVEGGRAEGGRWLNIQMTAPAANGCLRLSQHLLYRDGGPDTGWKMRHYVPLGTALNGMAYSAVIADFNVLLHLDEGLPPGEWFYVDRSAYWCSIWPFFRVLQSQTPPVRIWIDPY